MAIYDPLAARFLNTPLAPWQESSKLFHFDDGFVAYIRKYLEARKLVSDVVSAKAWINKAKFGDGERYELCTLQWQTYQESIASKPVLKAVAGDIGSPDGVNGDCGESDVDRAVADVEPDLPDRFKKLEGETPEAYRRRMFVSIQENIKKVGNW